MPQSTDVKSYFGSKPDWVSVLIALFLIWRFKIWHLVFATVISVTLSAEAQKAHSPDSILDGYYKFEYPGTKEEPKVTVNHSLTMVRVKHFDTKTLVIDVKEYLNWVDQRLGWSDDSTRDTRRPTSSIWTPDVVLYNDPLPQSKYEPRAFIYSTGHVLAVTSTRFFTDECKADGDIIRCHFRVGSWTYNGNLLDLQLTSPKFSLDNFVENDMYEVVGTKARRKVRRYDCCTEDFVSLTNTIKLKARK